MLILAAKPQLFMPDSIRKYKNKIGGQKKKILDVENKSESKPLSIPSQPAEKHDIGLTIDQKIEIFKGLPPYLVLLFAIICWVYTEFIKKQPNTTIDAINEKIRIQDSINNKNKIDNKIFIDSLTKTQKVKTLINHD